MFERFTDGARRAVVLAHEEAGRLGHDHIGTEHILLGLVGADDGEAALVLESLGVSLADARAQVEEIVPRGRRASKEGIPFTPRAKKVLELSLREALQLHHSSIGTGHVLLGLMRERDGVGAQVLVQLGVDLRQAREQMLVDLGEARVACLERIGDIDVPTWEETSPAAGDEPTG